MRGGGGANYRTSPVVGYDAASNNAPIRGITNLLTNLMVGKTFRPGRNETFDVQLNVQNVFAEHAMIPLQARGPGQFSVFTHPRGHRNWDLKASYRFGPEADAKFAPPVARDAAGDGRGSRDPVIP